MRIFRGEEIDRPALKFWGARATVGKQLHEAYRPVSLLAARCADLFEGVYGCWGDLMRGAEGRAAVDTRETGTGDADWVDVHRLLHTPKGDLEMVHRRSLAGDPGYDLEHYVKEKRRTSKSSPPFSTSRRRG